MEDEGYQCQQAAQQGGPLSAHAVERVASNLAADMGLEAFEQGVERLVSGVFSRGTRPRVRPVDLGRLLLREIDEHRSVDARGRRVVPNSFAIHVCSADLGGLRDIEDQLLQELCETAREYAKAEGFNFLGPVSVSLSVDDGLRVGRAAISSRIREGAGAIVLSDGARIVIGQRVVTVGRHPDSVVPINDPNVSRHHCEISANGTRFVVTDLGSTNGTRVNGTRINGEQVLVDGDTISVGTTHLRFEAS